MYTPPHFEETDPAAVAVLVEAFPLCVLVAATADGILANHIPVLADGARGLIGHVALANDLHRRVGEGEEVLAIFRGDDAYVSPNWYPSKAVHHRVVPTWNYEVAHVYGRISWLHDDKAKIAAVGRLTKVMEGATHGDEGWRMADAPRDYMRAQLDAIVAFRIETTRVLAKAKLSQNRERADVETVVGALDARGRARLAARMLKAKPPAPA